MTKPEVFISWQEPTAALEKQVWVSVDGDAPYLLATITGEEKSVIRFVPRGRIAWWVTATYGDTCAPARSPTAYFDHDSPDLERRRGARRP